MPSQTGIPKLSRGSRPRGSDEIMNNLPVQ